MAIPELKVVMMADSMEPSAALPIIDRSRLDRLTMKDRSLQEALFNAFQLEVLPRAEDLQSALNAGDCDKARHLAHFFKGATAQLACTSLEAVCRRLEEHARAGASEDLTAMEPEFTLQLHRLMEEVRKSGLLPS